MDPRQRAEAFLKTANLYKLGVLATESRHPKTTELSDLAMHNLNKGYETLKAVDLEALDLFTKYLKDLVPLAMDIQTTLREGGRIFICGCGATGRLALNLEYLWRRGRKASEAERVISFMAGGDVALVHALEGFEDFPEYGAKQLRDLGFRNGDLLISSTEGGETPFVIGATEAAARVSSREPYFLYCNPREVLVQNVERSRRALENPHIHSINLFVGPMALAGSTRMQASTVLMLAIGLALLHGHEVTQWREKVENLKASLLNLDLSQAAEFTRREADLYQQGHRTLYAADEFAITVMTDITERAPTFSLAPFDNKDHPKEQNSFSYLYMPQCENGEKAWRQLLGRAIRSLEWPEVNLKATRTYLDGFDFSRSALEFRQKLIPKSYHLIFHIDGQTDKIIWKFDNLEWLWSRLSAQLLDHLLLKMILNAHSTLIMGRLGRYTSNLMTYVVPTNGKLIDRASRYILSLAERDGIKNLTYEQVVRALFIETEKLKANEPIVLKTLDSLK